jgi:hypothetical protein
MFMTQIVRACSFGCGVLLAALAVSAPLSATAVVQAPEIDGTTMSTGLATLAAGVLILRARWGK